MSNRSYKYVIVTAPAGDNRNEDLQQTHEFSATNALRAANKARRERAEKEDLKPTQIQVLDCTRLPFRQGTPRTNSPE